MRRLDERQRYETYARLAALRSHWPRRFRAIAGTRGERTMAALEPFILDENRYLKLRRIALAHLAAEELRPRNRRRG